MALKHEPYVKDLMVECCMSTKVAAKTFFPELFYTTFAEGHDQIFDLIDSGAPRIVIAAPRGIGKTTIARTVACKDILFRARQFIPYVSCSATVAEMQTENMKAEFLTNPIIRELFNDIRIADEYDLDDSFSKKSWTAFGSTLVLPRGAGQQIRGLNWRGFRPQLIVIDDLEDSEEVLNEENRKKLKNWFFSDLMKSVNRYLNDWRIIYIDTIKHEDALICDLIASSDWESLTLSICDEDYKTNFPDYMSTEEVLAEVESHREKGLLDLFYREYMNLPISTEDATFMGSYFKYYDEFSEEIQKNRRLETFVIIDPAKTVKLHSAESAVIGISIDRETSRIYIRDLVAKKMYPDELYETGLEMCKRLKSRVLAVEVTSLENFIVMPIKNLIHERNLNIELLELKARGKKEDRIAHMVPLYRTGKIYHNKTVTGPLEAQLLSFPRCKRFDAIDAEAYLIEVMETAEKYFYRDGDDEPNDEPDYDDYDEAPIKNWRRI